jgi:hypothetical protein
MQLHDLRLRLRKLEEFSQGLAIEAGRWRGELAPLLAADWHDYLNGLLDAMTGVEQAKGSLFRACQRMERGNPGASSAPRA